MAKFYGVSSEAINNNYKNHKDEFESDGVEVLRGKELKEGKFNINLPLTSSQETVYTPRGVLRMGFVLRDSEVARQVRNVALNIIEGVGRLRRKLALDTMANIEQNPCQTYMSG